MRLLLPAALLLLFITRTATFAEIDVTEWRLRTTASQEGVGFEIDLFQTVQFPFQTQHSVSLPNHVFARASYDFTRDDSGVARFFIDHDQTISGGSNGFVQASISGRILFRAALDSVLSISGSSAYNISGGDRSAVIQASIRDAETEALLLSVHDDAIFFADPSLGTLLIPETQYTLQADHLYSLFYRSSIDSLSGSVLSGGDNDGEFLFELSPIPEPASASLFGAAMFAFARRRCRV